MAVPMQQLASKRGFAVRNALSKNVLLHSPRQPRVAVAASRVVAALTMTECQTLVQTLASQDFQAFMHAHAGQLTVVDFFTPMCGPCKVMAPVLERWAQEYDPNQVIFAKVDCADPGNRKLAMELGVKALPTFLLYKGAEVVAKTSGSGTNKLKLVIEENL